MLCCAGILADGLHCGVCVVVDDTAVSGVGPLWVWPLLIDGRPPRALSSRSHPTSPLRRLCRQTCHPSAFLLFPRVILLSSSPFPLLFVCICHPSASPLTLHREQSLGSKVRLCLSLLSIPSRSISLCSVNRPPPPRPVCTVCVPVTG